MSSSKSEYFSHFSKFTIEDGYVFYNRLKNDVNMHGYETKIDTAFKNISIVENITWERVSNVLKKIGYAEQKKEIEFFKSVFKLSNFPNKITLNQYESYIKIINKWLGLRKQYGPYLKELQAQSTDTGHGRAAGPFRYFETRLSKALSTNITKKIESLSEKQVLELTDEKIEEMINEVLEQSIRDALDLLKDQYDSFQGRTVQLWQKVFEGLDMMNSEVYDNLIQNVISKYHLKEVTTKISSFLKESIINKKSNLSNVRRIVATEMKSKGGGNIEGILTEYIRPMIAARLGGTGTVIGKGLGKGLTDKSASDSIEIYSVSGKVQISESLLSEYLNLNTTDIDDATQKINKLTEEIFDQLEDGFVIYESSKMYRLNGKFSTRGFSGREGNLSNLGAALNQLGGTRFSFLTLNIANILYQTMNGAILYNMKDDYIDKTKMLIMQAISGALFDDVDFQGFKSKNDRVIHMLDLDLIQVPLSYYCIALANAIDEARKEVEEDRDLATSNFNIKQFISINITGLPDEITFKTKEETKEWAKEKKYEYPESVYRAWEYQAAKVKGKGHFKISFLRNFNDEINKLAEKMLT